METWKIIAILAVVAGVILIFVVGGGTSFFSGLFGGNAPTKFQSNAVSATPLPFETGSGIPSSFANLLGNANISSSTQIVNPLNGAISALHSSFNTTLYGINGEKPASGQQTSAPSQPYRSAYQTVPDNNPQQSAVGGATVTAYVPLGYTYSRGAWIPQHNQRA